MGRMIRHLVMVTAVSMVALSAHAGGAVAKVLSTKTGTVTGTLSYASAQFRIQSGKESFCVMYDDKDDDRLMELNGKKVTFTGPIQTWDNPKMKRCIVVNPSYPKEAK